MTPMNNYRPEDISPSMRKYLGMPQLEEAKDAGTSEGVRKAWLSRKTKSGVSNLDRMKGLYFKHKAHLENVVGERPLEFNEFVDRVRQEARDRRRMALNGETTRNNPPGSIGHWLASLSDTEVCEDSGTSEGAKKGWMKRGMKVCVNRPGKADHGRVYKVWDPRNSPNDQRGPLLKKPGLNFTPLGFEECYRHDELCPAETFTGEKIENWYPKRH